MIMRFTILILSANMKKTLIGDFLDLCVDAVKDASNFVPDELVAVELVVDEGVKRLSESVYDALEEASHQMPK